MEWKIDRFGYITKYLVSGLKEEEFEISVEGDDQLEREKQMRSRIFVPKPEQIPECIQIGEISLLGLPWQYHCSYGNWFVDMSKFYPTLKKVQLHAATVLRAQEDMETEMCLWSYSAVAVWVNGRIAGEIEHPCYKPIQRRTMKVVLKKGDNLVYICLCNLGVRDTKSLFGLQIAGAEKKKLRMVVPGERYTEIYEKADEWLCSVKLRDGKLLFAQEAPQGSRIVYDSKPVDFDLFENRYAYQTIEGEKRVVLKDGKPYIKVEVPVKDQILFRNFERHELLNPEYCQTEDCQSNYERVYKRIASIGKIPRGEKESFSIYPILARYYTGQAREEDEQEIIKSLRQISIRRDCSDFLTCGLVRLLKLYPLSSELANACRETLLNYRYWMDENGTDGMCFWSENHSLMFFVSAYIAGDLYPGDLFVRSGKTGQELKQQARKRIFGWMTETLREGFDEFHSGGYTPITFAAILNVIDFADDELAGLAWKAADKLLEDMAYQTFQGVVISPMGRVYREVLYPFAQDILSLVNLVDPKAPDRFSEWIIFLATSRYRIPKDLKEKMKEPLALAYEESNARICVERQKDYMLTSVESPRRDQRKRRWENQYGNPAVDKGTFEYVKSLNECFHGTTQFEPGVLGYQQHMWYGALSPAAVVFVNHPGCSCEAASTRPGYWFGNGVMPALKQEKQVLYGIYQIPENHPVPFTHVYWPQNRFEEQIKRGNWITARVRDGCIGLWCSEPLEEYDDWLAGCEFRAVSRNTAYLCVCGSLNNKESLEDFLEKCENMEPVYKKEEGLLKTKESSLRFKAETNLTQYV